MLQALKVVLAIYPCRKNTMTSGVTSILLSNDISTKALHRKDKDFLKSFDFSLPLQGQVSAMEVWEPITKAKKVGEPP